MAMTVPLPEEMEEFFRERASAFGGPEGYLRHLLDEDRRRTARTRLEAQLLEGLEDDADDTDPADWAALRRELDEHIARRAR